MSPLLRRGHKRQSAASTDTAIALARAEREIAAAYHELRPKALAYVGAIVPELTEDLVDDAFADLWASVVVGNVPQSVSVLYFRILHRRIADALRRQESVEAAEPRLLRAAEARERVLDVAAREGDAAMLAARINQIVQSLPEQSRNAVMLALQNDWDARAVSNEMRIPYNTVRWMLLEAKRHLADTLKRDGYDIPAFVPRGKPTGEIQ